MAWIAFSLGLLASGARAELWGYVDAKGTAHFASEKVDDRYQLFFKGETTRDIAERESAAGSQADQDFSRSRMYQYVTAHPNAVKFGPLIELKSRANNLDPALVKALIAVESAFDPAAISAKGALGLMQVTPDTGARYGVTPDKARSIQQKLLDPVINLTIGTRYLHDLMVNFSNDIPLALAAYNAGEQAVRRYQPAIPPFPETQEYVKLINQFYALYRPPPARVPATRPLIPRRRPSPG